MALTGSDWTTHAAAELAGRASSSLTGDENTALAALAAEIKLLGGSPVQILLEACNKNGTGPTDPLHLMRHKFISVQVHRTA